MRENILQWLGYILRRENTEVVKVVKRIFIERKRGRRSPKKEVKECYRE